MKKLILSLLVISICSCSGSKKEKTTASPEKTEAATEQVESVAIDKEAPPKDNKTSISSVSVDFDKEVENFIVCKKAATKRTDCRNAITKLISQKFGLTEFSDATLGYVLYDSIRPIAERSRNWLQLGTVNQESIDQALAHADRGGLSLIIDTSASYGHVVMILPGESKKSGSWNMKLPNVLSLSNHKPEKSFSGKSLSYAMKNSEDLKIFLRQ